MECRYPATVTLFSEGFQLKEKPTKKMFQFDMKVETIFEAHELLKRPQLSIFSTKVCRSCHSIIRKLEFRASTSEDCSG